MFLMLWNLTFDTPISHCAWTILALNQNQIKLYKKSATYNLTQGSSRGTRCNDIAALDQKPYIATNWYLHDLVIEKSNFRFGVISWSVWIISHTHTRPPEHKPPTHFRICPMKHFFFKCWLWAPMVSGTTQSRSTIPTENLVWGGLVCETNSRLFHN